MRPFLGGAGFSDDLHIALLAEKVHQLAAGRWFVIHNEYAHGKKGQADL